jgi:uncharacterized protein YggE
MIAPMGRHVTVTGRGHISAPYDAATLSLAANARAAKPADAAARAAYSMNGLREALLAHGITAAALVTTAVQLNPVHDPWPTVVAYEATLSIAVSISDLGSMGSLLVAAVEAGGDGARVDGVSFRHQQSVELEREARALAFADARLKAEQYAELAGQVLGEVRQVLEADASMARPGARLLTAVAADMPIDAGDGQVDAVITVSWALGPAV